MMLQKMREMKMHDFIIFFFQSHEEIYSELSTTQPNFLGLIPTWSPIAMSELFFFFFFNSLSGGGRWDFWLKIASSDVFPTL